VRVLPIDELCAWIDQYLIDHPPRSIEQQSEPALASGCPRSDDRLCHRASGTAVRLPLHDRHFDQVR